MGYSGKVISGDCHVDIPWLPADLFTSNAPAHLKDRMPHVEDTKDGEQWFAGGRQLGCVGGAGIGLQPSLFWDPYVPGVSTRLDRMEEKNFFTDAKEGLFHPTTPELRIKDQDTDGIKGEVLYGVLALASGFGSTQGEEGAVIGGDEPSGPGYGLTDPDAILSAFDIYNQYIADFCNTNPDRLAALACLFARDPQEAARQVHRAAELGLKGTELNVSSTEEPIYLRDWDPLWAAVDESGLPISFHTVGLSPKAPKRDTTAAERAIMTGVALTVFQLSGAEFVSSIILSGACERYPNMKFVLGECGVGWLPYVLFRMDDEAERWKIAEHGLKMKPSEYWHRQGYSTFQIEYLTNEMVETVGEDNILWGSDYPHPDCVWPDSRSVIDENLGHLDEDKLKKIVCDNTAKLYGFPN